MDEVDDGNRVPQKYVFSSFKSKIPRKVQSTSSSLLYSIYFIKMTVKIF